MSFEIKERVQNNRTSPYMATINLKAVAGRVKLSFFNELDNNLQHQDEVLLPNERLRHDEEHGREFSNDVTEMNSVTGRDGCANRRSFYVDVDVNVDLVAVVALAPLLLVEPVSAKVEEGSEGGFVLEHDLRRKNIADANTTL